jgi:hypothetical protein
MRKTSRRETAVRKVNMTISLAFLAPDLVKAAIEGRLPHGMGVVRLADLPAEWSRQAQQAMAEYQAELRAMREKTARLRALRLARDTANQKTPPANQKGAA